MARAYVGLDPGLRGACGVVTSEGLFRAAFDLPVIGDKTLRWVDAVKFKQLLTTALAGDDAAIFIERVSAMPKQGVASSFQFGIGVGSLLGVVHGLGFPMQLVTSGKWKPFMKVSRTHAGQAQSELKKMALDRARMMFPTADLTLVKHEARAEALLIAYYGMTQGIRGFVA